jgi:uncharacterized protein YjdB
MCKNKYLFILLGLLLLFTILLPLTPLVRGKEVFAKSIEEEKNDYKLNMKSKTLVKGKTFPLSVYNLNKNSKVSFKSGDSEIASVDNEGVVTANKVGDTTITVVVKDSSSTTTLSCDITVGPPAFSVKLTRSRIILEKDKSDLLRVILKPTNTPEDAAFQSNDKTIVYVSPGGRVDANDYGYTNLFARIDALGSDGNQKNARCSVIVVKSEDVPLFTAYFENHPELNLISDELLDNALSDFFNKIYIKHYTKSESVTNITAVEALNKYLDEKFDLKALRDQLPSKSPVIDTDKLDIVSDSRIA